MTAIRHWTVLLASVFFVLLSACGGGGQGLRSESSPLIVSSTSVPLTLSGQVVNHVIPIEGGCGGPFVLQVIEGVMPRGVYLDDETHSIQGGILEDGEFAFTLQITDTGCTPFASVTASFEMSVGVGDITVVDATRDGDPVMIPAGAASYNPDYPSIGTTVYNDYATIELVVAGGRGPWTAEIHDRASIPDDGPLPLGVSLPPSSTSVTGAPVQVGPNGGPFLITLEITDSVGAKSLFTFYWLIETPPIVFATDPWADGQAGVPFSAQVYVVEGVPPFVYELVEEGLPADYTSDKSDSPNLDPSTDVIYNPGAPPTVTPAEALVKIDASYYPSPSVDTTIDGVPPEGVALREETGSFSGIPRRRGSYRVHAHVQSTLVPNNFGQHAWGTIPFSIAAAPPIQHDPAYTLDPAFTDSAPYARLVEANKGSAYNPDGGPEGLQLLATGGVPDDGNTDAPHVSQFTTDPAETPGEYKWTVDWNPDAEPGQGPMTGMELLGSGVFRIVEVSGVPQVDDLVPQFDQTISFTASDSALPVSAATTATEKVAFGIGPDRILVTQSSTAVSNSTDHRTIDDTAMTLKYVIPTGSWYTLRVLNDGDLTGDGDDKHDLPSEAGTTAVGTVFTNIDILRTSINPTGYWDDNVYLNPNAARPWQNAQRSYYYYVYGPGSAGSTGYTSSSSSYGFQSSTSCVRLPKCGDSSVTANKSTGVYTDGGKFHVFDTATHFGVFIVRQDGRIYVPAAFQKSTSGYYSFGDNWSYGHRSSATTHSATRLPQMTVSPDGRFAALKLRKNSAYSRTETASTTDVLLISLTGERISAWDDESYLVIGSGSSGSSTTGVYLYASSLTLTNGYLYYIIGNQTTYAHFRDHYIYRYDLNGGASAGSLLHSNFNSEWTNTAGSPMQMPFQYFGQNFTTSTSAGNPDYIMYASNGYNCWEGSKAPHPFRVNSEGNACAMLAGLNTTATTAAATDVLWHHVWVDYEGSLRQLSTQRRHTSGGGRGIALSCGPSYGYACSMWNDYNGPTSRFEISDDGLKVAVVYYRNPTVDPYTDYNDTVYRYREDISAYVSTGSTPWSGVSVREVTGDTSTNTGYSTSYVGGAFGYTSSTYCHNWRFGALTFTKTGDGLVFWGGRSNYDHDGYAMSYYRYASSKSFEGSLYSYDFSSGNVRSILSSSDGGCSKTVGSIISTPNFSTATYATDAGVIKPVAGFRSMNGDFLYIVTKGAVSTTTTKLRDGSLIGVNVRSLDTSTSINGRTDGRAFYVNGFGTYNGFLGSLYPYAVSGIGMYSYSSNYSYYYYTLGYNDRVAAMDTGWIYFTSVTASTSTYTYASSSYGGPIRATYGLGYPYYPKKLYVFDPNVGGNVHEISDSGWYGSSYQHVSGLVVSDDGTRLIEAGSTYTSYNYHDYQNLTVFSGMELNPTTGALVSGSTSRQRFEYQNSCGECAAMSPKGDSVYYAAGTGSTSTNLKKGVIGGSSTGSSLGLAGARWGVLHAGR